MIKILIIEDEIPARKKLKRFIENLNIATEVVAEIDTVETAVDFLKNNKVDLIFSDIELLDGSAFEIYQQVTLSCPIIFSTAYDQFWMNAFESNGIAYLLKPYSNEQFQKAWDKFMLFQNSPSSDISLLSKLTKLLEQSFAEKSFKKRFTVRTHHGIYFLDTENITHFETKEGVIFAFDTLGKKHLLTGSSLKEIEEMINPEYFFKINRSELVNKQHIEKVERYAKNTLTIKVKGNETFLSTSQSNTHSFREWLEK